VGIGGPPDTWGHWSYVGSPSEAVDGWMEKISFPIFLPALLASVPAPLLCAKSPVSSEHGATWDQICWDSAGPWHLPRPMLLQS
jgi:hypothetical protein